MLEEQCNTWGGITSVAVYLPLVYFQSSNDKKLQEAISHVEDFHEQIDRTHGEPCSAIHRSLLHAFSRAHLSGCNEQRTAGVACTRPAMIGWKHTGGFHAFCCK